MEVAVCRVCTKAYAKYQCPRCNMRTCSIACYKKHSQQCVEGFSREHVTTELRATRASDAERRQMMEILQRQAHQQEAEEASSGEEDEVDADDGCLPEETLSKLVMQSLQEGAGLEDVREEDLSTSDLAAFRRELASGNMARLIAPWEPWWLSREAGELSISTAGTSVVDGMSHDQGAQARKRLDVWQSSGLPPLPANPLPRLQTLIRAEPALQLRWHLLDLLYAYCLVMRLYNGDPSADLQEAAATAVAVSAALRSSAQTAGSNEASAVNVSPASALLGSITAACSSTGPAAGRGGRAMAVSILADVKTVLDFGRAAVICALEDLRNILALDLRRMASGMKKSVQAAPAITQARLGGSDASSQQAEKSSIPQGCAQGQLLCKTSVQPAQESLPLLRDGSTGRGATSSKPHRKSGRLAMERKLRFFLSWANEQPLQVNMDLAEAVGTELAHHSRMLEEQSSKPTLKMTDAHPALQQQMTLAPRPLIECESASQRPPAP